MRNKKYEKEAKGPEISNKLVNRTIDALLLGFDKPIRFDYFIPQPHYIVGGISFAVAKLFGNTHRELKNTNPANARMIEGRNLWHLSGIKTFENRVKEGLERALTTKYPSYNGEIPIISNLTPSYCLYNDYKFGVEWFFGYGNLFRFRAGEREKAEKNVKEYFNEKEMANFRQLYEPMREYVSDCFKGMVK